MLKQLLLKTDRRCLYKFVYNLGVKGAFSFSRHKKQVKKGKFFPAFHFISVTDDCNLYCQGCWVAGKTEKHNIDAALLNTLISSIKKKGSYFFGILGGEPLMYKTLTDVFQNHPDCYFQLFTNGTLLTPAMAEKLRRCANVSPLISLEGNEFAADIRRGGSNIYKRTLAAIDNAIGEGLVTGVAISVCKSNLDFALSEDFIRILEDKGVLYLWYYIYRPAGSNPSVELTLDLQEIRKLRKHIVNVRSKTELLVIDTYWDADGNGLCPAASGLSHHINAGGYIEPCPVIQFSTCNIQNGSLDTLYRSSGFLENFRKEVPLKTSGCILMEDPGWLADFAERHGAKDTSGRGNEFERLRSMHPVAGHGSCSGLPEKNWWYRFAKKRAFFGLGAYG